MQDGMQDNSKNIKASYKHCPVSDRKQFSHSSCLLPISLFQPVHDGKKFEATIELINRTFKACTILIDDVIQRHTLKIIFPEKSDEELYQMTLNEGDAWIERNRYVFEQMTIPYSVARWEYWLLHPEFKNRLSVINDLYDNNLDYQMAINFTIAEYLTRNIKKGRITDHEKSAVICLKYIKEECAVMTLWSEEKYGFEVYPTGRNLAMRATYEYLIKPLYPNLIKSVSLRFKKS